MMVGTKKGKTLILGMGNKFFGDDGVGIVIAEKLEELLSERAEVDVESTNWGGLRIIDLLSGYNAAIVIDAIKITRNPLGYIHKFDYRELINTVRMVSFHDVNFATAVEFAKKMNIPMPGKISIYAIEIKNSDNFSETMSPEVETSVDKCIRLILDEITETHGIKINHTVESG